MDTRRNSASSAVRTSFPLRRAPDQQLVDLAPSMSTISNCQPVDKALALAGHVLEHRRAKPGGGRIVAVLGQIDAEPFGQRVGRDEPATSQLPSSRSTNGGSVSKSDREANLPASAASRSAGRHQPSKWPYSSWTKAIGTSALAQHVQRVHRVDLVGHDRRLAHQRAQVERLARDQGGDDVARLDDADQLVDRAFGDRDPVVRGLDQRCADRLGIARRRRSSRPRCAASSPRGSAGRRGGPRPR